MYKNVEYYIFLYLYTLLYTLKQFDIYLYVVLYFIKICTLLRFNNRRNPVEIHVLVDCRNLPY